MLMMINFNSIPTLEGRPSHPLRKMLQKTHAGRLNQIGNDEKLRPLKMIYIQLEHFSNTIDGVLSYLPSFVATFFVSGWSVITQDNRCKCFINLCALTDLLSGTKINYDNNYTHIYDLSFNVDKRILYFQQLRKVCLHLYSLPNDRNPNHNLGFVCTNVAHSKKIIHCTLTGETICYKT